MRYCDLRDSMSSTKSTARLVAVCQREQTVSFEPRQVPIHVDEHLIVRSTSFLREEPFSYSCRSDETPTRRIIYDL